MGLEAVRKHPGVSTPGYFRIVPFGTAGRVQVMAVCKDRRPKIMGSGAPQPYRETSAGGLGRPKTSRPGLEIGVLRTDAFSVSYAAGRVCSPAVHTIRVSELTLSATELTLSVTELTLSVMELTLSVIELTLSVIELTLSVIELTLSVIELTLSVIELTLSATELTLSVVELTLSATELTLSIIKLTVKDGKSEENGEFLLFARRL
jgi:hypothetical protein